LALVALLNPSESRHLSTIRAEMKRSSPVLEGVFGVGALTARLLVYHNYLVFSRMSYKETTFSTGFMGFVVASPAAGNLVP